MQVSEKQLVIAIDPGSRKCGLAVVDMQSKALELRLVHRAKLCADILELRDEFAVRDCEIIVVMGNGTQHKQLLAELRDLLPNIEIKLVEEYGSTLEARELYWQYNKPNWWQKMIPASWRSTPALDAYAALVIGRRYIDMEKNN